MGYPKTPYPPCDVCTCRGDDCTGHGYYPPGMYVIHAASLA